MGTSGDHNGPKGRGGLSTASHSHRAPGLGPARQGSTGPAREDSALRLLEEAHAAGGEILRPGLRIRLAHTYGFCQGVKRAVDLALAAAGPAGGHEERRGSRLFVTGEIIHNPSINAALREAGIRPLPAEGGKDRFAEVRAGDRVIIPAFGIPIAEEHTLAAIGCQLIDTTCGWVRRVWQAAEEFSRAGLTLVIHGRAEHEETRATASRIPGPWIVVRDRDEAAAVARVIREPGPAAQATLPSSRSPGFDPSRHLERIGLVNQTTMLDRETQAIGHLLTAAIEARIGGPAGPDRFRALDTFCTATQRRQDAVRSLLAEEALQCLIVVGGFRSSNTAHLASLGSEGLPTYHVEDAACLESATTIRHLPAGAPEPVRTAGWLPDPPRVIGITSGASTPDGETARTLARLIELHEGGGPRHDQDHGRGESG